MRNDEPGLADCWFPSTVVEAAAEHALVEYSDLQDEHSGAPLREWFPLPACQQDLAMDTPHTIHNDAHRYSVRPAPPPEVWRCLSKNVSIAHISVSAYAGRL